MSCPAAFEQSLGALFRDTVAAEPNRVWLTFHDESVAPSAYTLAETAGHVARLAGALSGKGLGPGDRVATQLDNRPDAVFTLLALAAVGAVWVPFDRRDEAATLKPRLERAKPVAGVAHAAYHERLAAAGVTGPILDPSSAEGPLATGTRFEPNDWRAILFTSGTTGLPKGVIVTERMMCAAGRFAAAAGRAGPEETFLLWEPLNHIGGAQMIPAALLSGARLGMVPAFSASRFWAQAKAAGATRMHYLGGVLDLLVKQPPSPADRDHAVRHGFGAAARPAMWQTFPERFGISLTEVYGQTEASSFCVANTAGIAGAIGTPLPEFSVDLLDDAGERVADGAVGEIVISSDPPGLLTPGYLDDVVATAAAFRDGRFHSGDLARRDRSGQLVFAGRVKEAIRRRGENVSALEIETALAAHPSVAECAVVGVPAEVGEEEILAFVRPAGGARIDPAELLAFLAGRLAPYQRPRFVRFVDDFPRTPSERIAKPALPRDTAGAWDAEAPEE